MQSFRLILPERTIQLLRKYNAAETLVGLAGTHRYSRVQAYAIYQLSDKISFNKFQWFERVASIFDLKKYRVHLL